MKTAVRSNAVRMLAMLVLGMALGLVAGARLFGPTESETIQSVSEPGVSVHERGVSDRGFTGSQTAPTRNTVPRRMRDAPALETQAAEVPSTLRVPAESLARVPVSAFGLRRGNPWQQAGDRFELTREVCDLLGIDDGTAEAVRDVFAQAHEESMQSSWLNPVRIEATEQGAAVTIAPSSSEARERISQDLHTLLGPQTADLLMRFSGETLDWEFGGFGRFERILEVTRLPDQTLSIRESLRPPAGTHPSASPMVERRVHQYRVKDLPAEIARFVEPGDAR